MVRIASLQTLEALAPDSGSAISFLVIAKIVPEVFIVPMGGLLADRYDRRLLSMSYDFTAGFCVLYYIVAHRSGDIAHLYIATIIRSCISSLDMPVGASIIPMVVTDPEDLKKAVMLNGMAWSIMLVLGGIVAGYVIGIVGVEACYMINSATYFTSVMLGYKMRGNFLVVTGENDARIDFQGQDVKDSKRRQRSRFKRFMQPISNICAMIKELFLFLWNCGFGLLVLMKASGTVTWGSEDILNVLFSQVRDDEVESSRRLGMIYSSQGLGCLIGPILATTFIIDGKKPRTMQLACISGLVFVILGWIGIANAPSFEAICFFSFFRCLGGSTIWIFSTLLLQNLVNVGMLGRVVSLESATASFFEACIAYTAGQLEDEGLEKYEIANLSAGIGTFLLVSWSTYHLFGYGAPRTNAIAIEGVILSKGSIDMIHSPTSV